MPRLYKVSEGTAARRRVPLFLVDATDGITPETGESGGQPQVDKNGAGWGNTTATLTAIGNGAYYVELTATELNTVGYGMVRYKSANTAECNIDFQVVSFDPYDGVRAGLTALPNAAADAAGGLIISDAGGLDADAQRSDVAAILVDTGTTLQAEVDGIQADTEDIQARLPAALTAGGNMKADVLALSGDTVAADNAEAFFDGTGYAGTNNVIPTVTTVGTLTTYTGNTPQTGDAFARLGAPAGASVSADIAAIEAQTDDIGVAGAGLTAVPWNAAWDAEVQSEVDDALVAQRLDELVNADSDIDGAAPPAVGSVFHELLTKTPGSFTYDQTTDSLEAIKDSGGGGLTQADVRTAVGLASANLDTQLAAIQADTDDIQTRLPAALVSGRMDSSVGAMAANVMTAAATAADYVTELQSGLSTLDAAGVRTAVGLASANLDTQLAAIDDYLDTEVAAIKAKTDNLPAAPAAVGDIPTANANADALLDRADAIETGVTLRQSQRLVTAAVAGKCSGHPGSPVYRDVTDTKDRITATTDADGNRTAVTVDAT